MQIKSTNYSKADSTKNLMDIAAELNVPNERIENVRVWDGFLSFFVNGREFTNKLTATGKHKKNSVRLATW